MSSPDIETFACRICEEEKPESEFYHQGNSRMHMCKECHRRRVAEDRARRQREAEKRTAMSRKAPEPEPVIEIDPEPEAEPEIAASPPEEPIVTRGRRLTSIKEACRYGKFSHSKLYELIKSKRIRAYKFDTRTLIDLDSIDAMFASLPEL